MGRHTEERNSLETRLLIRENNIVSSSRRVNELKTTISRLEYKVEMSGIVSASYRSRIRTLERKLTESEAYVEELTERLEEAEEVEGLKENIEELNVYIDRLEIKAEEQRKHINSLERNLQTTEEYLYEANEEIRCFNDLSDAQQSQILSFQRSVEDKNAIICGHEYELEEEAGKAYDDIYYCQR
ncbi:hypothetical protein COEREDRAFT_82648 [Coemansia reversa NRRL 1564]|uniref:Uncharacterized protein n=1 Tax=Coemansia reversa (strain ATCC 12441 / NRRL 1564) TaxID=763665 RepID=A0A2G5B6E9_COERN|nr:hypothetical protein COEREDRAFT_82648 [Coemansia reversa NRRL 1564]|eukprot:PIA14623.1 hypothetical protein COEREDRAFT_82648 [Coemansia reversa NRRL 1564]